MDVKRERMGDAVLAALQSLVLPFHTLAAPALGLCEMPLSPSFTFGLPSFLHLF